MVKQDKPPAEITTELRDIFGKDDIVELKLNQEFLKTLLEKDTVYIKAKTIHQARIDLAGCAVGRARRLGVKEIGRLAIDELKRQREKE